MINLFSKSSLCRIVLPMVLVWLIACCLLADRLNHYGAFASAGMTKTLEYLKEIEQADPGSVRLNQSYSQWALALNLTDASNYIKVGLGFAEGKGLSRKNISPADPNNKTYMPYYFQSPGTPLVIGIMIKLFGEHSVLPYFILMATAHLITALLTCILASYYVEGDGYILGAGLLSLLCLPVLDFNFGLGLFSSEPLSKLCIVSALIALSDFWQKLEKGPLSYKYVFITALGFGSALAIASYFRGIYTTFARFCWLILALCGLIKQGKRKQIFLFVITSMIILAAIQYPWQKRNKHYFGEFTMAGSTYHGYSMWRDIWESQRESAKWGWNAGRGIGNYLAPEKSAEVLARLDKNKKEGSSYALQSLLAAVAKKPWEAAQFKLKVYDTLWFGQRCNWYIYAWCVLSALAFLIFLGLTRFKFMPGLWLFPLFFVCLSPIIHYEHRYSQSFYFFVTPVAAMYVLRYFLTKQRRVDAG